MERIGFTDADPAGARGRSTSAGTRPSGRRCSPRSRPPAAPTIRSTDSDRDLFGTMEVDDFDRFRAAMDASPVNARWQADMAGLIDPMIDPATGFHQRLDEVFHLD